MLKARLCQLLQQRSATKPCDHYVGSNPLITMSALTCLCMCAHTHTCRCTIVLGLNIMGQNGIVSSACHGWHSGSVQLSFALQTMGMAVLSTRKRVLWCASSDNGRPQVQVKCGDRDHRLCVSSRQRYRILPTMKRCPSQVDRCPPYLPPP